MGHAKRDLEANKRHLPGTTADTVPAAMLTWHVNCK
jgi:hypothetical protein